MHTSTKLINVIKLKYDSLFPFLNERIRRTWAATEAKALGYGGSTIVCKATGMSPKTVAKGIAELNNPSPLEIHRIRRKGGGRKKLSVKQKGLFNALEELIEPTIRGDPESLLKWTTKSLQNLQNALREQNYKVSANTLGRMLKRAGYSLQANRKSLGSSSHKDRNAQFNYINEAITNKKKWNCPIISVDTKKKENLGLFKNNGKEYCPKGQPTKVNTHDFPDPNLGKVAPYGVYDIGKNKGWVSVGISADTAQFAVNTIRTWWHRMGIKSYPNASELVITADCGGSNGNRVKLWKVELQRFSDETGLAIHVHHFPPGTSKWNKIEHRLFSYISKNWRGRPLLARETVVNLISNTRTKKGLTVQSVLDFNEYKKGIKITKEELAAINIQRHTFHPEWNYTIKSRKDNRTKK